MGFANCSLRFIQIFSQGIKPLVNLTKDNFKEKGFIYSECNDEFFKKLKVLFISAPILRNFDPKLLMVIDADTTDFAISAILSQIKVVIALACCLSLIDNRLG
jgi:hypothetical protein